MGLGELVLRLADSLLKGALDPNLTRSRPSHCLRVLKTMPSFPWDSFSSSFQLHYSLPLSLSLLIFSQSFFLVLFPFFFSYSLFYHCGSQYTVGLTLAACTPNNPPLYKELKAVVEPGFVSRGDNDDGAII